MMWIQDMLPGMEYLDDTSWCPYCMAEDCNSAEWRCPRCDNTGSDCPECCE